MNKNTKVKVLNRDNGSVVYTLPEMNGLRRVFQPNETKQVTLEELQKLSYIPGGMELLRDSLLIEDKTIAHEILNHVEPEYSYTRDDVIKLLKEGSMDEFLDCLDFAPEGVKDLIKTLSVELPLNDVVKRQAILNKLNFNVDNAIRIRKESTDTSTETNAPAQRRVQKAEPAKSTPTRRTATVDKK